MPKESRAIQLFHFEMTDAQMDALRTVCAGFLDSGPGRWLITGKGCSASMAAKLAELEVVVVQEIKGNKRIYVMATALGRKVIALEKINAA